ncbi:SAP DNA-binding domain-containing protein [Reticulomyxa filosa]|uniref:SAP DNA-binding domain-containing protein n=1 Tax=Reticulomyxa filosa TaxID=46433 RepID=X6NZY3_RETFI|nr:SAP DNA-binding domain-containing protein [Reticulomyxa filosa]|eukprot:ETO31438.1 SAP DNA-binding domain-containing protein [Reticulomyxa filosa]
MKQLYENYESSSSKGSRTKPDKFDFVCMCAKRHKSAVQKRQSNGVANDASKAQHLLEMKEGNDNDGNGDENGNGDEEEEEEDDDDNDNKNKGSKEKDTDKGKGKGKGKEDRIVSHSENVYKNETKSLLSEFVIKYRNESATNNNNNNNQKSKCYTHFRFFIYLCISILPVLIILGCIVSDFLLATLVFFGNSPTYFVLSILASSVTLFNYTINSSLFFCYSPFCSWSGPFAPLLRCLLSLPPFGLVYTLLLIPALFCCLFFLKKKGVHSLPVHMLTALVQFVLNMLFFMTDNVIATKSNYIIYVVFQMGMNTCHLIFSPMFAWLQQSKDSDIYLNICRLFSLMGLWLFSIAPLTLLELINIFPVLIEKYSYNGIGQTALIVYLALSCVVRLLFLWIYVDSDGNRLGVMPFRKVIKSNPNQKEPPVPLTFCERLGYFFLQTFYFVLPLLPTVALNVRLYKCKAKNYALFNHCCLSAYLLFTYVPMIYFFFKPKHPGLYTVVILAGAFGAMTWVIVFLPKYLQYWKNFKW